MKFANTLKTTIGASLALVMIVASGLGSTTNAIPYDPNGTPTAKTPVFNQFTGVPDGVGNEADFVRVKSQGSGNGSYVNDLNAACNNGEAFTVRTYVHNGADPEFNKDEKGATAIARNTVVAMNAPLGAESNRFEFKSTISASNAASVSDNGFLTCANGKKVKLTLVEKSVKTYSKPVGYNTVSDSAVNGTLPIGSRVAGSGDVLACWDDRVMVVYDVKVEDVVVPSLGECKLLKVETAPNRRVTANIEGVTTNATIVGYKIDFGDGTVTEKQTESHQYAKDGTYTITAHVNVKYADGRTEWKTASACAFNVTFKGDVTPPPTPTPVKPTSLPATGPADVAAIVVLMSAISSIAYYYWNARRTSLF